MTSILTLRARSSTRACAAALLVLYVAFASGTAFGALDLLRVPAPGPACGTAPSPARSCCGCRAVHAAGESCCCSSGRTGPAAESGFTQAARCANPDSGAPGELARMSPHAAPDASVPAASPVSVAAADRVPALLSVPAAPEDKVPIAR